MVQFGSEKPWPAVVTKVPWPYGNPMQGAPGTCSGFWDNGVCKGKYHAPTQLGQTTELAQSNNTVNLGESMLPKLLTWAIVLGAVGLMVTKLRASPRGAGPDAIDELAEESQRIQRRVAKRKQMRRKRSVV